MSALHPNQDLFRLDVLGDLSLAIDRPADKRAMFIKRRWEAGSFRDTAQGGGVGGKLTYKAHNYPAHCNIFALPGPVLKQDAFPTMFAQQDPQKGTAVVLMN